MLSEILREVFALRNVARARVGPKDAILSVRQQSVESAFLAPVAVCDGILGDLPLVARQSRERPRQRIAFLVSLQGRVNLAVQHDSPGGMRPRFMRNTREAFAAYCPTAAFPGERSLWRGAGRQAEGFLGACAVFRDREAHRCQEGFWSR